MTLTLSTDADLLDDWKIQAQTCLKNILKVTIVLIK